MGSVTFGHEINSLSLSFYLAWTLAPSYVSMAGAAADAIVLVRRYPATTGLRTYYVPAW